MSSDPRTAAEIERHIEQERAELASSLDALQDRFSVEGITQTVTEQVTRHGGEFGHNISRSVKDNPVALALTGIGLAWMIYGDSRRNGAANGSSDIAVAADRAGQSVKGSAHDASASAGGTAHAAAAGASHQWDKAKGGAAHASASMHQSASDAKHAASGRWDRMRGEAGEFNRQTRASAEDLRARLHEGTENMSEEARRRVIEAREAAYRAQAEIESKSRAGAAQARDFFYDQPLVVGALAVAVGAAFGAALPRSKTEDDAVGQHSDNLFAEAERVFREEATKAENVVKATAAEAKQTAKDEKAKADSSAPGEKNVEQAAVSEAKSAAKRVSDKAKDEASKQDLGKPKV